MKRLISRVQDLQKKAAQVQQAIHNAPAQAAKLREAVTLSAGELHQLRSDIQSELSGLRTNSEEKLLQAMREINDSTETLLEAGYELAGMDLDMAVVQRLAVRLDKVSDARPSALRTLVSKETRLSVKSILAGLMQAEQLIEKAALSEVEYSGAVIHLGPSPAVRMCWRSRSMEEQVALLKPALAAAIANKEDAPEATSFFENRSTPPPKPTVEAPINLPAVEPETKEEPAKSTSSPWSSSALDRFKKMPDVSKYKT